jgi:hypothetical protein
MNKFQNRFFQHIMEQDNEREAMEASLDRDTNPADFDVNSVPDNNQVADLTRQAAQASVAQTAEMITQMEDWVKVCGQFYDYLNGEKNPNALIKILGQAEPKTLMDAVKTKSATNITDLAGELLVFKNFLVGQINIAPSSTQLAGI